MNAVCSSRGRLCRATVVAPWVALVCILGLANAAPAQGQEAKPGKGNPPSQKDKGPAKVEVRFVDDSTLKLQILDERLELVTPYGKLSIPVADIVKIEFAQRVSDEDAKKVYPKGWKSPRPYIRIVPQPNL